MTTRRNAWLSRALFTMVGAVVLAATVHAADVRLIRGVVVDGDGRPVPNAEVGNNWTPNDLFDENGKLRDRNGAETESKRLWANTGRMRPFEGITTDDRGRFAFSESQSAYLARLGWYGILAFDAPRRRGGVAVLHHDSRDAELVIRLQPLVDLRGKFKLANSGDAPKWLAVRVCLPEDEQQPLAWRVVAMCCSVEGEFSVTLPSGEYELVANTEDKEFLKTPVEVKLIARERDHDLGTLRLYRSAIEEAKDRGEWGDYTTSFGHAPPAWHVMAARGISAEVQPGDFKEKWTLLYFFNFGCVPCLKNGLPGLAEFCESNRDKRSQFEIIGFCIDDSAELNTTEALNRKLQPLVKHAWKGKDLPFPILLDNSLTTVKAYGIQGSGTEMLIDPEGRLVKGGLKELSEKLGADLQFGENSLKRGHIFISQ